MSRSRKKTSCCSDYSRGPNGTKADKRNAAKAVRNHEGTIPNGNSYKRLFCSYNIHDYKSTSWDVADNWYERGKRK